MNLNQFISAHLGTVDHLRVLLHLKGTPRTEWDVLDVAAKLYLPPKSAAAVLAELTDHGLVVAVRRTAPLSLPAAHARVGRIGRAPGRDGPHATRHLDQPDLRPVQGHPGFCRRVQAPKRKWHRARKGNGRLICGAVHRFGVHPLGCRGLRVACSVPTRQATRDPRPATRNTLKGGHHSSARS